MESLSRICAVSLILGLFSISASGLAATATITANELNKVFQPIKENDWAKVEQAAFQLINRQSPGQRYMIARLRYIYFISLAIQLENNKLTVAQLKDKLKVLEEKLIIQPWHPVKAKASPCFNKICASEDNPAVLVTTQANDKATQIYSFEYFDTGAPIDISSFDGAHARLGGILHKIEINPNLFKKLNSNTEVAWYLRLRFRDGFIQYNR